MLTPFTTARRFFSPSAGSVAACMATGRTWERPEPLPVVKPGALQDPADVQVQFGLALFRNDLPAAKEALREGARVNGLCV